MRAHIRLISISLAAAVALVGCRADHEEQAAEGAAVPAAAKAPASDAGVTMRYACAGGNRVDVLGGNAVRVTLADGRVVEIPRTADTAPPAFAGEALAFAIGNQGATLHQEEGGEWDCKAG